MHENMTEYLCEVCRCEWNTRVCNEESEGKMETFGPCKDSGQLAITKI